MRLFLNNVCVSGASSHYNYKCYIEAMVNYSALIKNTSLQTAGWYGDTGQFFDSYSGNGGFTKRMDLFSTVKKVPDPDSSTDKDARVWSADSQYFIGPVFSDLDSIAGLCNGVKVKVELRKAKAPFFLFGLHKDAIFTIEEAILHVPIGVLHPQLATHIERRLSSSNMKLNFRRRNLIPFQVPKNSSSFYSDSKFKISSYWL